MRVSGLVTLGLLICASGDAAKNARFATEAFETAQDPPMYIYRNEVSPRTVSSFGAFTSYQVNVDANGNNITGDAGNEPSLTVDPTNHNKMTIGWRQFDTVASNFRQAGWGYTTNGGLNWTFPGVLQQNVFRSDPVLNSDDTGRFFYLSLETSFFDDMFRSLDGGMSWSAPAAATGGDKQWFTIDRTNSSGHGFQYQCWSTAGNNYNGRQFTRSTDGGLTWMNPINIPNSPIWGTLDVDTNGNLYLVGINPNTDQIWVERSTNAKNGAVTPSFDRSTQVNLGGTIDVANLNINPEGLIGQLYLAVDKSGTITTNNIYLLASLQPTGFNNGSEVMFARSTDGGQSFSPPVRVNDDPVNHSKWHWLASMSVAPDGRIDAVWLDSRNAANNTDSQLFYSYSNDAGVTWSANVPASASFNPKIGYPNQNKIGDYISSVSDNSGADVAYAATFNGEEDIYYVRVAPLLSDLANISTRAHVLTGQQVMIAGLIVEGTAPKRVLIRGIGPTLSSFGLTGVLADPAIALTQGNTLIANNDNWKVRPDGSSQQADIEATGRAPANDSESALVVTLDPGNYTAILAGSGGGTGLALVEVYDLSSGNGSDLSNISTRGFVGIGQDVMIGGVIIGAGNGAGARVIVRAIGPSLGAFGVQGALADPVLGLFDANGNALASNDNWRTNAQTGQSQEAEVTATGFAPGDDRESALVTSLAPGNYTAIVSGSNGTSGVALVEVYKLP